MADKLEKSRERVFFFLVATLARTHILSSPLGGRRQCLQALALHRNQE
jgi:hypothetical protein